VFWRPHNGDRRCGCGAAPREGPGAAASDTITVAGHAGCPNATARFVRRRAHPAAPILGHAKESSRPYDALPSLFAAPVWRGDLAVPPREVPLGDTGVGLYLSFVFVGDCSLSYTRTPRVGPSPVHKCSSGKKHFRGWFFYIGAIINQCDLTNRCVSRRPSHFHHAVFRPSKENKAPQALPEAVTRPAGRTRRLDWGFVLSYGIGGGRAPSQGSCHGKPWWL
jgi:hypothetical protein